MSGESLLDGRVILHRGDCLAAVRAMPAASIDSVVTDPPYALVSIGRRFGKPGSQPPRTPAGGSGIYARAATGFMGQSWDTGETAFAVEFWAEVLRVLKPGGHVVALAGTRTYHRLACAIEDAGFEIRDQLAWVYGSGFPKSHDVSKGIDKAAGAERTDLIGTRLGRPGVSKSGSNMGTGWAREYKGRSDRPKPALDITAPATDAARQWQGWGTALKPSWEPICLARKPLIGTVAANVLAHDTGALNIDGCRVGVDGGTKGCSAGPSNGILGNGLNGARGETVVGLGRWPANLLHDGSDEVVATFPETHSAGAARDEPGGGDYIGGLGWGGIGVGRKGARVGDLGGSAARFFYSAKADADDRLGSTHPTVKPVDLIRWLVRLVTPPGGVVLDPFAGTGTTGEAAWREGCRAVLVERDPRYQADLMRRMDLARAGPTARKVASHKARARAPDHGPLFSPPQAAE